MKKNYLTLLLSIIIFHSSGDLFAQANSVTLTPPAGGPTTYPSITSAYAAIPTPVTGNYLIELQVAYNGTDASEVYPIALTDKGLLPGGFTITIRPAAGNTAETIQRPVAAAGPVVVFNGADNTILDGRPGGVTSAAANYLTVNDPFSGSIASRCVELMNSANNNTLQYLNCVAADATAAALGARVILVGSTTTVSNKNNIIQNCVVSGGMRGIQDFGLSDAVPNVGTIIQNNTVRNFSAIGIFAGTAQSNITIQNNTVTLQAYNPLPTGTIAGIQQQSLVEGTSLITNNTISLAITSSTITGVSGIIDVAAGTDNITNNTITNFSAPSASLSGIVLNSGASTLNITGNTISTLTGGTSTSVIGINLGSTAVCTFTVARNKISGLSSTGAVNVRGMSCFPFANSILNINNNFVALMEPNPTTVGIFGILFGLTAAGSNYTTNAYFNTIRVGGAEPANNTAAAYGAFRGDNNATSVFNFKNNISIMERTGGGTTVFAAYNNPSNVGILNVDYNTYYATDPVNGFAAAYNGTGYTNAGLAAYKTASTPNEQNSNFTNVNFVSTNDLHLSGASNSDPNLDGTPIPGITTDIDGHNRSAVTPSRGADEKGSAVPTQLISFIAYRSGKVNVLKWSTAQEINTSRFIVERSTNGRDFTLIGEVAAAGNSQSVRNYQYTDNNPVKGINYYRIKTVDIDNSGRYGEVRSVKNAGTGLINLYPNPAVDITNLSIDADKAEIASIMITDMKGAQVYHRTFIISEGTNLLPIDLKNVSKGYYTMYIKLDNESFVQKFSKL